MTIVTSKMATSSSSSSMFEHSSYISDAVSDDETGALETVEPQIAVKSLLFRRDSRPPVQRKCRRVNSSEVGPYLNIFHPAVRETLSPTVACVQATFLLHMGDLMTSNATYLEVYTSNDSRIRAVCQPLEHFSRMTLQTINAVLFQQKYIWPTLLPCTISPFRQQIISLTYCQ